MTELQKTFDPAAIEEKWYTHWETTGAFRPSRPDAVPFTIVMPPPNVTGSLHIGHALDNTLQDILIRHARLQGKDALWVAGTDHAGIATQMVVERQMNAAGQKRTDFSREDFIAKVWDWKRESGGTITGQLRRLGASCDWSREQFTMDPGFEKAVIKVFDDLYNQGLLYRDKRLVNWDPGLKTAISDLEVETREINGKFWHFKYPLEDGSGFISVATTRPETMLADMAVAVNPTDARYAALVGKNVRLPITGRLIPIITDDHADPELGSGAVKITPGHDFNDFEVGKRAGMAASQMLNMLDAEARVVQCGDIPEALLGLSVVDARKAVVALIDEAGLLEKVEDRVIQTPFGDRSGVVIEPWLTDQWYVDAKTLAGPAIEAVRSGAIKVVPQTWEKTYFNWMENIQPWCVSRQLWWGHQIPVWYGPDYLVRINDEGNVHYPVRRTQRHHFVEQDATSAIRCAQEFYDEHAPRRPDGSRFTVVEVKNWDEVTAGLAEGLIGILRDPDVLDTWFSSALWPFGTLGWPEESPSGEGLLERHYPGDVLISGFDILFFWDARMIMQGLHFMQQRVPFKTLYLHGLVRAADGSKMSKSKGNSVDPLGLIDQYGADALRFTLTAMESQGRDIKLDEKRVEGYRNFATKLWNAARFAQANGIVASTSLAAPNASLAVNRWIIGEVVETLAKLDKAIADLRFDAMADTIYHFAWGTFCDWYLELIKPAFVDGEKGEMDAESKVVAGWVFDQILVMLHPFMPFITEELWSAMGVRKYDLIHAQWPAPGALADSEAKAEIDLTIKIVSAVRAARTELGISPGTRMECYADGFDEETGVIIKRIWSNVSKLAKINWSDLPNDKLGMGNTLQVVVDEITFALQLEGAIDLTAERTRLTNALAAITKDRDALAGRLSNPSFVERAKPEAVEKARADHAEKAAEAERLEAALARLG